MNRSAERASTVQRSYELLPALQGTLVGLCLSTLCLHLDRFAEEIERLPPDLVQCVVDALAAQRSLNSTALETIVAAGSAPLVDRIVLRLGEPLAQPSASVFDSIEELEEYVRSSRRPADSPFGELQAVSLAITLVNDAWLAPLASFTALTELEMSSCYYVTDEPLCSALSCLPLLRSLDLDRCKRVSDAGLTPLAEGRLPRLHSLGLGGTRAHTVLHALAHCTPELRTLDASGSTFGDWQLRALCGAEEGGTERPLPLRRLAIAKTRVSNAALLMALSSTLESLDLSFNPDVKDSAFLGELPQLSTLDVSLNHWVDDEALSALCAGAPRLERLNLEKTDVTDDALAQLGRLHALRHLDLGRTAVGGSAGASWAWLRRLEGLETLYLPYCPLALVETAPSIVPFFPPSLRHLKLSRVLHFDDAAVLALAERSRQQTDGLKLTALDLGSPGLTNACVPALCALVDAGLTSLRLWHTRVTRVGIVELMATARVMGLDTTMSCSEGTYLLRRVA